MMVCNEAIDIINDIFYRGALLSKEDLKQRIIFETREFEKNQERTITDQNLEAYQYHSVKYVGYYCAYYHKCCTEDQIREELNHEDINIIHTLIKFLFSLSDKTFEELENCFNDFQRLLDSMVSQNYILVGYIVYIEDKNVVQTLSFFEMAN